ncbi:unnamed protein product, partial [Hymenolepis diminuta]
TGNRDLPSKPRANVVSYFRHRKKTSRRKRKEKDRSHEKEEGIILRKLEIILDDLWTAAH